MGKGDLRSKRGKIHRGTFGNTRRRKKKAEGQQKQESYVPPPASPRPAAPA
jgi:ribosomal small subunit protein bTHX